MSSQNISFFFKIKNKKNKKNKKSPPKRINNHIQRVKVRNLWEQQRETWVGDGFGPLYSLIYIKEHGVGDGGGGSLSFCLLLFRLV
jgi:hypothetical protein